MSDKKLLVVFGATGIQGGSVIKSMLGDPKAAAQFSLRAITRDISKPAALNLVSQGVEVVAGDLNDKASILSALKGAYAVYLVTDFWATLSKETEIIQGKNVADAAKECEIQHLIFSSLPSPTELTNGTLTKVSHFDSKAAIEKYIRSLSLPATFLMPGTYMSTIPHRTLTLSPSSSPTTNPKTWQLTYPLSPTTPLPLFASEHDTGKFVKAILLHPLQTMLGKQILAATAYLTPLQILSQFQEVFPEAGRTATFVQASVEEHEEMLVRYGMERAAAGDLGEMMRWFEGWGYFGGEGLEESLAILDEPLMSWKEYMERAEAFKGLK